MPDNSADTHFLGHSSAEDPVHGGYDDEEYISGVHREDATVFTALVRAYLDRLTRFAFGYLGDEDAAHDIVQEVFARVWALGTAWRPASSVAAYLFTAVRHRAYNVIHANKTRERVHQSISAEAELRSPNEPYLDLTLVAVVRRELHNLTERQREILRLRYEQGYTVSQAAEILGIDVRAAEKLAARGLTALRARLAEVKK